VRGAHFRIIFGCFNVYGSLQYSDYLIVDHLVQTNSFVFGFVFRSLRVQLL